MSTIRDYLSVLVVSLIGTAVNMQLIGVNALLFIKDRVFETTMSAVPAIFTVPANASDCLEFAAEKGLSMTEDQWSTFISMQQVGGIAIAVILPVLSVLGLSLTNHLKATLSGCVLVMVLYNGLIFSMHSAGLMYLGRFLLGIPVALASAMTSVYVSMVLKGEKSIVICGYVQGIAGASGAVLGLLLEALLGGESLWNWNILYSFSVCCALNFSLSAAMVKAFVPLYRVVGDSIYLLFILAATLGFPFSFLLRKDERALAVHSEV